MSDSNEPKLIFTPPGQMILPAFKKEISQPKIDWRKWKNERGEQIDSPPFRGPQFTGKIIPPLVDSHGRPIKDGSLQIVRDAKGIYKIIDWSLPADKTITKYDEDDEGRTAPIMGRPIYETRHSLERGMLALHILANKKRARDAGLPDDPVQCKDLAGKPIFIGKLVLAQYARGRFAGCYVIIDTACDIAAPKYRLVMKKDVTLKRAVALLVKESKTRKPAVAKKTFVAAGAPIKFEAPAGFGGFGGDQDRECPTPDSKSWDVTVDIFARTGKWFEQATNYREEYLADPSKFYDEPVVANAITDDGREIAEGHALVRDMLESFEGATLLGFKSADEA
jgi:hypothetical protein